MNVKNFLNKIRKIDLLIDTKLEEVSALRDRLTNITVNTEHERVQTSMQGDKFADTIAKIIELEEKVNADIDLLVNYKSRASELIEKLDDDILKVILYKRYFEGRTFEEIAVTINYSWRWTCKLHGRALQKLNEFVRKEDIEIHIASVV
jgi:DNA-directed RNA polymerase specialized sigma subunit